MRFITFLCMVIFSSSVLAKPLVVASFSILGDMVHQVGQDKIEVKSLVGANQDTHVFEPRPQNAKDLVNADLVVVNGLGFEGWFDRLIEASGFQGKILVATAGITPLMLEDDGSSVVDPHAWHSLNNAKIYVDNIVKGLSDLLPEDAHFFKEQGEAYKQKIDGLSQQVSDALKTMPADKRKIITNHDAFGYLGHEYGITFYSPLGISTDAEPSAKSVAKLINKIKQEKIHAVFVENISNPRLLNQITSETGTTIGGVLYSDALSDPGTEADTYLKMMAFNLGSLTEAMKKN